ncbi:hypothetical protein HanOQP8_Chr16g0598901 [Helianthus annuus]|nr:hypothetical protein HanOQP8_Chr16g0598901 [Helianthus annuus]
MIKVVCILVTVALSNMSVLLVLITTIKRPFKSGIHIVKLVSFNNQVRLKTIFNGYVTRLFKPLYLEKKFTLLFFIARRLNIFLC